MRGSLNGIFPEEIKNMEKVMEIKLLETKMINFDLIFNNELYNSKMKKVLGDLEKKYTNYSDREMVYFICIRDKIRFDKILDVKENIVINIFDSEFNIKEKREISAMLVRKRFGLDLYEGNLECTEDKIIYTFASKETFTIYIYDFIEVCSINLGVTSKIVYVGETDFPTERPYDKAHDGMTQAIYKYKNLGNDIFIYYNLFHIIYKTKGISDINIHVSNSLVEIFEKKSEGRFIQNALIYHLLPKGYSKNYKNEIGELRNKLKYISDEFNVTKVSLHYSVDHNSDFYIFYSELLSKTDKFNYSIKVLDNNIIYV